MHCTMHLWNNLKISRNWDLIPMMFSGIFIIFIFNLLQNHFYSYLNVHWTVFYTACSFYANLLSKIAMAGQSFSKWSCLKILTNKNTWTELTKENFNRIIEQHFGKNIFKTLNNAIMIFPNMKPKFLLGGTCNWIDHTFLNFLF